jgi:hypothetical protein
MPRQGLPAFTVSHRSANAEGGMSGWRTILWFYPAVVLGKTADVDECPVGVGDAAFHIGLGHDGIDRIDHQFVGGNRQIDLHLMSVLLIVLIICKILLNHTILTTKPPFRICKPPLFTNPFAHEKPANGGLLQNTTCPACQR